MVDNPSNHRRISLMDFAFHNDGDHHMIRLFFAAFLIALSPAVADAKGKKSKPAPVAVTQPAPAPAPAPKPAPSFMDRQIAAALANTRPVGVTTYGAMASAVAAGQAGGDPVAAAEAASAGW